jgi:phage baseplate assembly protein W
MLVNEECVRRSIKNLIETFPGERFYNDLIGSTVSRTLFEFADQFTADRMQESIVQTINNFEPRAQNLKVMVTADPIDNSIAADISFSISALPGQVFSVPTIVIRNR